MSSYLKFSSSNQDNPQQNASEQINKENLDKIMIRKTKQKNMIKFLSDGAFWPETINESLIEYYIINTHHRTREIIYCYICKLFSKFPELTTDFAVEKDINMYCSERRTSWVNTERFEGHVNAMLNLKRKSSIVGCVDTEIAKKMGTQIRYR